MQTFLPYPDFTDSAIVLDRQRLGKQRVETKQILQANIGVSRGWVNHPASRMWKGHEIALANYGIAICVEWRSRGYKDTLLPWFDQLADLMLLHGDTPDTLPPWLGNEEFHASHRSKLLAKKPDWYSQFDWTETPDMPYVWPVNEPS